MSNTFARLIASRSVSRSNSKLASLARWSASATKALRGLKRLLPPPCANNTTPRAGPTAIAADPPHQKAGGRLRGCGFLLMSSAFSYARIMKMPSRGQRIDRSQGIAAVDPALGTGAATRLLGPSRNIACMTGRPYVFEAKLLGMDKAPDRAIVDLQTALTLHLGDRPRSVKSRSRHRAISQSRCPPEIALGTSIYQSSPPIHPIGSSTSAT